MDTAAVCITRGCWRWAWPEFSALVTREASPGGCERWNGPTCGTCRRTGLLLYLQIVALCRPDFLRAQNAVVVASEPMPVDFPFAPRNFAPTLGKDPILPAISIGAASKHDYRRAGAHGSQPPDMISCPEGEVSQKDQASAWPEIYFVAHKRPRRTNQDRHD